MRILENLAYGWTVLLRALMHLSSLVELSANTLRKPGVDRQGSHHAAHTCIDHLARTTACYCQDFQLFLTTPTPCPYTQATCPVKDRFEFRHSPREPHPWYRRLFHSIESRSGTTTNTISANMPLTDERINCRFVRSHMGHSSRSISSITNQLDVHHLGLTARM